MSNEELNKKPTARELLDQNFSESEGCRSEINRISDFEDLEDEIIKID